jgi:hypothetical protein
MVWQIDLDSDSQIVVLSFAGLVTGPELLEAAAARIEFGKKSGIDKYIIDAAEMIAPQSTMMDVQDIPNTIYEQNGLSRNSLIAVVRPRNPTSAWIAEFYENASILRGWRVRIVDDYEAAVHWLQHYGG